MLDQLITQAGFTHETLADRLNVRPEQVRVWVNWEEIPSIRQCIALADALNVSLERVYLALLVP